MESNRKICKYCMQYLDSIDNEENCPYNPKNKIGEYKPAHPEPTEHINSIDEEKIIKGYIEKNTKGWDKEMLDLYLYEVEQNDKTFAFGATSPAAGEYWMAKLNNPG
jgi:hypothetical protein